MAVGTILYGMTLDIKVTRKGEVKIQQSLDFLFTIDPKVIILRGKCDKNVATVLYIKMIQWMNILIEIQVSVMSLGSGL